MKTEDFKMENGSQNNENIVENETKINDSVKRVADAEDETDEDEEEETEYDIDEDSEELFEAVADECGCDSDDAKKIIAVARMNGDSFDNISSYSCDGNRVEIGSNQEYYVYDDYYDAESEAIDMAENNIDEMGLNTFSDYARDYVIENFVDYPWEDDMHESNRSYIDELDEKELIERGIDEGIIDEDELDEDGEWDGDFDDLRDQLVNNMDGEYDSMEEYMESIYGSRWYEEIDAERYLDTHAAAEWCVETDGVAHYLAGYDGEENEEDVDGTTYYIYRWN